ncbi:hypothetical protein llap_5132 [Limosa lapponica baueri]|uniref:Uncharacterized protein n=1 Tax=Limosa lapponica baueri TaxID=1758121 RepID=A0A2I0UEX1_LIMLA|nr:hypothetical protein llap_5132 [Limosa lapponica baueri]
MPDSNLGHHFIVLKKWEQLESFETSGQCVIVIYQEEGWQVLWDQGEIQGNGVFKTPSTVKVYSTGSENGTKNLKAVTVSRNKHRKVNQKDNYQSHSKYQGKVLQMAAVAGKYLLEAMHCM